MNWPSYFNSLVALVLFAACGWLLSLVLKKVSHVDSMWSLFFILSALVSCVFRRRFIAACADCIAVGYLLGIETLFLSDMAQLGSRRPAL